MNSVKVLFVCTGNVFRSMTAECCLKSFLKKVNNRRIRVSSAGIEANYELANPVTIATLSYLGINIADHVQTKLTEELVRENDIIVSMAKDHQQYIMRHFGEYSPLFNEIAHDEATSVKDIESLQGNQALEHFKDTVLHIYDSTPLIYQNLYHFTDSVHLISWSLGKSKS